MRLLPLLLAVVANPAFADPPSATCRPASEVESIRRWLAAEYGEQPTAAGISAPDGSQVMELYTDPQDGSWTIMAVGKEMACLVATGSGWIALKHGEPA